jgi:streptogramin lyase
VLLFHSGILASIGAVAWRSNARTRKHVRDCVAVTQRPRFVDDHIHDLFADGNLWVLDLGGKITRVDPKTGHSVHSYPIWGDLQGMAVGGGYVWVTDATGNDIQRIPEDLQSASTPILVGQIGGQPRAVAYDDGSIVVGFGGGTISKINPSDPTSPAVIWTHPGLGNDASSITVDRDIVWAAGEAIST